MELFEFLMILVSVIIGLALGEVLMGSANLLRERETVRFYWIHVLFQVGVFLALIQQWWESWGLAAVSSISFGAVLAHALWSNHAVHAGAHPLSAASGRRELGELLLPTGANSLGVGSLSAPP